MLSEYRTISLNNFLNKIIFKLVCNRLAPILPMLISENQSGFIKEGSISKNKILAQEIKHGIKKPIVGDNMVIKLDLTKTYDRMSWSYICLAMRKMGFDKVIIYVVWRIISNNWYSILVNGVRYGFFHSTKVLKHGGPPSPALFIIGAEVLSRLLNKMNQHYLYKGFNIKKKGPQVNHPSFANN